MLALDEALEALLTLDAFESLLLGRAEGVIGLATPLSRAFVAPPGVPIPTAVRPESPKPDGRGGTVGISGV